MNIIRALHETAMEYGDMARIAKAKGASNISQEFYAKAFDLEKEAALKMPLDEKDPTPRYILIRSAASLAMMAGNYEAAEKLITLGLTGNPPIFIKTELKDLTTYINLQKERTSEEEVQINGVLTYANAAENEIKIQDRQKDHLYTIIAPNGLIKDLVKSHFLETISIDAILQPYGIMLFRNIRPAA